MEESSDEETTSKPASVSQPTTPEEFTPKDGQTSARAEKQIEDKEKKVEKAKTVVKPKPKPKKKPKKKAASLKTAEPEPQLPEPVPDVEPSVELPVPEPEPEAPEDDSIDEFLYAGNFESIEEIYRPSTEPPGPVYQDDYDSMEFDLVSLQNLIKDDEDFEFAKLAFKDMQSDDTVIKDVAYWAWKQNDDKAQIEQRAIEDAAEPYDQEKSAFEEEVKNNKSLQNVSGCFRTEGYHKIPDKLKVEYLPHRRRLHQPLNTVQTEDDHETQLNNIQSSRVNRANNRRYAADISAQKQALGSETDILNLNQLTKRKKPVQFARSAIHNWGLYALEPIAAKEMIIEYVGERIRQAVAEVREKRYLKSGIGSSYLFRIDENTVIDASKKGGIARFINHCCVPSCTAKIIKVEGKKRIVIYALRDIAANEELTYDYKFERETNNAERIPCLCGAVGCKGFLN
ncbi:unnamed protein product [Ambrosiozyma monospora]|uniref:Unnamed protein product n=1 Tax=Ambrosiozyma monospora TaxID=43982 RepID=A0ACB5TAR0_AMBMO|nr:unnamed protein product [Ambrosiozyma monospora]